MFVYAVDDEQKELNETMPAYLAASLYFRPDVFLSKTFEYIKHSEQVLLIELVIDVCFRVAWVGKHLPNIQKHESASR